MQSLLRIKELHVLSSMHLYWRNNQINAFLNIAGHSGNYEGVKVANEINVTSEFEMSLYSRI